MLKVEFYRTLDSGQQEACGYLYVLNGKIKEVPLMENPINKITLQNVMKDGLTPKDKKLMKENPLGWLKTLPTKYSGTYFRAAIVKG